MAQGEITTTAGLALLQLLVQFFGTRKVGMTGPEKKQAIVNIAAPLLPVAAGAIANNSNSPEHKAEVAVLAQGFHDALQANGLIHDTASLEQGTPLPATPPISAVPVVPAPQVPQP